MLTNAKAIQFICKISGQNGNYLGLQQREAKMATAGSSLLSQRPGGIDM